MPAGSLARKSAIAFAGQTLVAASNVVTGVLIARYLGPEGKGAYAIIGNAAQIALALALMGLPMAATYHVGRHASAPWTTVAVSWAASLGALGLLMVAARLGGLAGVRIGLQPETTRWLVLVLWAGVPAQMLRQLVCAVLRGRELIAAATAPEVFTYVLRLGATGVVLVWLRGNLAGAVQASVAAWVAGACVAGVLLGAWARDWPRSTPGVGLRKLLSYGLQAHVAGSVYTVFMYTDLFLVNRFLGQGPAGVYAVARLAADVAGYPAAGLATVLFPRYLLVGPVERRALLLTAHRVSLWATLGAAALVGAGAGLVPRVCGADFAGAVGPTRTCLAACVLWSVVRVVHYFFAAENRQLLAVLANVVGAGAMVGLNLALVPRYGLPGAAAALLAAVVCTYALSAAALLKGWQINTLEAFRPRWSDAAALAGLLPVGADPRKSATGPGDRGRE
jgi:O-antigen/teichoic acid export membrane protein